MPGCEGEPIDIQCSHARKEVSNLIQKKEGTEMNDNYISFNTLEVHGREHHIRSWVYGMGMWIYGRL